MFFFRAAVWQMQVARFTTSSLSSSSRPACIAWSLTPRPTGRPKGWCHFTNGQMWVWTNKEDHNCQKSVICSYLPRPRATEGSSVSDQWYLHDLVQTAGLFLEFFWTPGTNLNKAERPLVLQDCFSFLQFTCGKNQTPVVKSPDRCCSTQLQVPVETVRNVYVDQYIIIRVNDWTVILWWDQLRFFSKDRMLL